MSKYLIALSLMCSASLFAHTQLEVFYMQVDSMYLEAVVNDVLRVLHKEHHKVKTVQYAEVDAFISSFMIIYEKKKQKGLDD